MTLSRMSHTRVSAAVDHALGALDVMDDAEATRRSSDERLVSSSAMPLGRPH